MVRPPRSSSQPLVAGTATAIDQPPHSGVPTVSAPSVDSATAAAALGQLTGAKNGAPVGSVPAVRLASNLSASAGEQVRRYFESFLGRVGANVVADPKIGKKGGYRLTSIFDLQHVGVAVTRYVSMTQNHTAGFGNVPRAFLFVVAQPAIFVAVKDLLLEGLIPIHGREDVDLLRPIVVGESFSFEITAAIRKMTSATSAILNGRFLDGKGKPIANTRTVLSFRSNFNGLEGTSLTAEAVSQLGELRLEFKVTQRTIDDYRAVTGDDNIIHVDDKVAKGLGLRGRILHGMYVENFATRALYHGGPIDTDRGGESTTKFFAPVYPGDTLRAFVGNDGKTTVLNQDNVIVLEREVSV